MRQRRVKRRIDWIELVDIGGMDCCGHVCDRVDGCFAGEYGWLLWCGWKRVRIVKVNCD